MISLAMLFSHYRATTYAYKCEVYDNCRRCYTSVLTLHAEKELMVSIPGAILVVYACPDCSDQSEYSSHVYAAGGEGKWVMSAFSIRSRALE